jgi:hypothetical protein
MKQKTQAMKLRPGGHQRLRIAIPLVGVLTLVACMSKPLPPTEELKAAEQAIGHAEQARVADYASPELQEAREKLTAARNAIRKEDMTLAKRMAEQSRVEAELALAKAEAAKARVVNEEMKKGTRSLEQEMQRNTGVQQ